MPMPCPSPPAPQRARGHVRVGFGPGGRLAELYQSGSAKALLPRTHGTEPQAVIINTAGGLTGGDAFDYRVTLAGGARATVATQTAERVYRSAGGQATLTTRLKVEEGARLDWLPQETILFEGAALSRRLEADLAPGATLLCAEAVVLGRAAMGETPERAALSDQWRIRRDGRLVHAEALRLAPPLPRLRSAAGLGEARAIATLLLLDDAAEDRLAPLRALLPESPGLRAAASAWEGRLVVRLLAREARPMRALLMTLISHLRGAPLPRVWTM